MCLVPGNARCCIRCGIAGRRSWHFGNQGKSRDSKLQAHFSVIWTQLSCRFPFHCLQHFWKGNQRLGASLGSCFVFSLESWCCFCQLWSVEIPWRSHNNRRQRTSFALYSSTGLKGCNLPTNHIWSYNFINPILSKQVGILSSELASWSSVEGKTLHSACVKLPASHDN